MNDTEIIKALECCVIQGGKCEECPYESIMDCDCEDMLLRNAFDLINRQKAEIERLESNLKFVRGTVERLQKYDEERDIRRKRIHGGKR